ncbi:MAG: hypothetical protein RML36_06135 [Anaerolineae bacterium]|nr:hypothetical protein [Anaerolineae bacterium]MDW8099048.1 hypothetical protein [Anaerolineae bacterium]
MGVAINAKLDTLFGEQDKALKTLVAETAALCPAPLNSLQVAALLEANGITDAIARQRYGYEDVFALAEAVLAHLPRTAPRLSPDHVYRPETRWEVIRDYLKGGLGLLPMILLSLIFFVYQEFGRWQISEAWTLSISMLGSLLITSGFVQAASRKGTSYLSQGYIRAAQKILSRIISIGLLAVAVATAALVTVMAFTGWISERNILIMAVAFSTLSCLWLAAGVLFLLDQVHWFALGLGIALALSTAALHGLAAVRMHRDIALLGSTAAGLLTFLLVTALVIRRTLHRLRETSPVSDHEVVFPALPQMVFSLLPYFAYGVSYIVLIIAGHVTGWIGIVLYSNGQPAENIVTLEIGLTIALAGYILSGGAAERTIRQFWRKIRLFQLQTPQYQLEIFREKMMKFYHYNLLRFTVVLVLCNSFVLICVLSVVRILDREGLLPLRWPSEATIILVLGLLGYSLMAYGAFNSMFMVSLSRPCYALKATMIGILVTLIVGVVMSFSVPYYYNPVGIVVGSAWFAAVAYRYMRYMWKYADYHYYASF